MAFVTREAARKGFPESPVEGLHSGGGGKGEGCTGQVMVTEPKMMRL